MIYFNKRLTVTALFVVGLYAKGIISSWAYMPLKNMLFGQDRFFYMYRVVAYHYLYQIIGQKRKESNKRNTGLNNFLKKL